MAKITIRRVLAILAVSLIALAAIVRASAQTRYQPSAANLAAREWFQNARFGLFVHWGVYSVLGDGEWVMFDPAEWVALAKAAGMKYITITSKHDDGFAMFDSKISDYDVVDRTPYKKDVLKALADECHKQGISTRLLCWRCRVRAGPPKGGHHR